MEEDICFTVMLSLVSRDPSFQIWGLLLGVLCWSCLLCICVFKGVRRGTFSGKFKWQHLQLLSNYQRLFFTIQMQIIAWKRGKNLFSSLKSLQLALRAVILSWIHGPLPKSPNWSKIVIARHFCRVFFSTDDNWKSHDIDFFLKYAILKELKSPPFW